LNGVAGIQKEMKQTIVSTYANRLLPVGIFYFTKMAKEIKLTQGKVAIVDDDMFDYLNQFKWFANLQGKKFYAGRNITMFNGKRTMLWMHRFIMNPEKGMVIDHLDGNPLNNQKNNLRICTHAENMRNSKINKNNKSGHKGVYWHKTSSKWMAYIKYNNKLLYLGYFPVLIDAAKAYNEAALKYHGEFANLNKID
jgi:hypothetical protein